MEETLELKDSVHVVQDPETHLVLDIPLSVPSHQQEINNENHTVQQSSMEPGRQSFSGSKHARDESMLSPSTKNRETVTHAVARRELASVIAT